MNEKQREALITAATAAQKQAYAPYSRFEVGAALLGTGGTIYIGTNVENASYGLTNCAERVAVGCAIADGERHFEALAVASVGGAAPCGACRQVLLEFAPQLSILLIDTGGKNQTVEVDLEALVPMPFSPHREER